MYRIQNDYGHDVTTAGGARAHLRDISHRPLTRGGYISIVGRLAGRRFNSVECDAIAESADFVYRVGEIVRPDSYNPDPREECTHGIHFFLTRKEAEEW